MHSNPNLEMAMLTQISRAAVREKNVSALFAEVLEILDREMGLLRGTLTLRQGDTLFIEASHGLTEEERLRGKYRLGEGVTGNVALNGKPQIIPDISKDPNFLNRTRTRKFDRRIAFVCVPIIHQNEVIGTMSIDSLNTEDNGLERDLNLLEIVANLLAEAVSVSIREHRERELLLSENDRLRRELDQTVRPPEIIGNCNAMKSVYAAITQVAQSDATVMIRGSSGTGKELVAKAVQRGGVRRSSPFVAVSCAALPESLVESELFGHEKGSFTGAVSRRIGRLEAANTGTLFLDEIGDLSLSMQVKLLRFIQERTFQRVGSNQELYSDVRIMTATSRNLEKLMEEGRFREDLYYRLNVVPIHLPDLKDRGSDILLLAEHFLEKYNHRYKRRVGKISTAAINMMMAYHWPGNVRELENCIERTVLTVHDGVVHSYSLPPSLQSSLAAVPAAVAAGRQEADFSTLVDSFERELLDNALKDHRGNVAAAARQLGLTPRIAHYKIKKLNLNPAWYK